MVSLPLHSFKEFFHSQQGILKSEARSHALRSLVAKSIAVPMKAICPGNEGPTVSSHTLSSLSTISARTGDGDPLVYGIFALNLCDCAISSVQKRSCFTKV